MERKPIGLTFPYRKQKHDHRQSLWLIAGGTIAWCYQCGAWKLNTKDAPRAWNKPTGIGGKNPAMKDI